MRSHENEGVSPSQKKESGNLPANQRKQTEQRDNKEKQTSE
jgi:hypothetical protein